MLPNNLLEFLEMWTRIHCWELMEVTGDVVTVAFSMHIVVTSYCGMYDLFSIPL